MEGVDTGVWSIELGMCGLYRELPVKEIHRLAGQRMAVPGEQMNAARRHLFSRQVD